MGSRIITNDTLQITSTQGFPPELDYEQHSHTPFTVEQFADRIFSFHDKPGIRVYQVPPVRNFLIENKEGKWLYWGLIHIIRLTYDYVEQTTSGEFKIIYINTPEEMRVAHDLIDRNPDTRFFT